MAKSKNRSTKKAKTRRKRGETAVRVRQDDDESVKGTKVKIPAKLPILPIRDAVMYPSMVVPLSVQSERDVALIDYALQHDRFIAAVPMVNADSDPVTPADLHTGGCSAIILKMLKVPDGTVRILIQGLNRVKIDKLVQEEPFLLGKVTKINEEVPDGVKTEALHFSVRDQFNKLIDLVPQVPDEVKLAAANITHPGRLVDLIASNVDLSQDERIAILDAQNVCARLEVLSPLLGRELQIVELGSKIQEDVKDKISKGQREYFLREQLKAIRAELGETDDEPYEIEEIREALDKAGLSEEAMKEATRELKRIEQMNPSSAEYTVSRTYLDWMTSLPWQISTSDRLDVRKARKILDAEHYNLVKVKDRIIEFLAVRKIHPTGRSPILCLAGPPGVGKTSLGRSIAAAMGRKFVRISLGGVRDEAEIRGHRRTYIGALPGRIIQGLRKAESNNPIFMLDEIDKVMGDSRGDPSAALLEVLDPEQNNSFSDHYLDVAFDLSKVIFITTANHLETIPAPLRDRMEILQIPGYSEEEKLEIAKRHLIPRVLADHGLTKKTVSFDIAAIKAIIGDYTREAGLRVLERTLATTVRKVTVKIAKGKKGPFRIKEADLVNFLGAPRFFDESFLQVKTPGMATGLVWSPVGGGILFIEATRMAGKKQLILTGRLGEVIRESAQAALSWIRTHAKSLGIDENFYDDSDIHIHFPEGATPKDGPSAGVTLVASLISLLTNTVIDPRLAMTGEVTLRGKVLPVGGIKEKMLGARRAGIRHIVLPEANMQDLDELPKEIRKAMTFHPVSRVEDMLAVVFPKLVPTKKTARKPRRKKTKARG